MLDLANGKDEKISRMTRRELPDYDNPPAQETWMAFGFVPLEWRIPHFGAFWSDIKSDYPKFEVHPPIGDFSVEFNALAPEAGVKLPVRCWFINEESNRLIQVQDNRFLQNWRRPNPSVPYLHYGELRPMFLREWDRFCAFARTHGMGVPNVQACEVSYINHLDRGVGWDNFSDISIVFPSVGSFRGKQFLGKPETVSINSSHVMREREGRLRISVQPAIRQVDGKEIIQLTITGSCRPSSNETGELTNCVDLCREWVVRGFDDFTSESMHEIWRKK